MEQNELFLKFDVRTFCGSVQGLNIGRVDCSLIPNFSPFPGVPEWFFFFWGEGVVH